MVSIPGVLIDLKDPGDILCLIFGVVFTITVAIRTTRHNNIRKKLKNGKNPSFKTKGIIKSINYLRGGHIYGGTTNIIALRYISVEAIDPITKEKKIYESERFKYNHNFWKAKFRSFERNKEDFDIYIKQYVKIGDSAEIIISKKNPKVYYIPEPTKK